MVIIQEHNTTQHNKKMQNCIDTINRQALRIMELEEQVSALRRELANVEEKEPEEETQPETPPETPPETQEEKIKRMSPTYKPMHAPELEAIRFEEGTIDDCEKIVKISFNKKTGVKYVHLKAIDEKKETKPRRHTVYYEKGFEYYKRKNQGGSEYWDKFSAVDFFTEPVDDY